MITLNNVPVEQKKKIEYLPKRPIYPYIVPTCPKCHSDKSVVICVPSDPKQYYCFSCLYDFFYVGCLNCLFADRSPFSFSCVRCSRNPVPEPTAHDIFYGSASHLTIDILSTPMADRWEVYKKIDLSWADE